MGQNIRHTIQKEIGNLKITVEVSLYPLSSEYEKCIIDFINQIKSNQSLDVYTHSMSTYIKGDSDLIFSELNEALKLASAKTDTLSMVLKVINRSLPVEEGYFEM